MPDPTTSAEDAKLVTLARGARGRVGAVEGAALRDETGRTYAAATVALSSLHLTALQGAVAQAAAAGARGIEEAVVVTEADHVDADSMAAVRDLGGLAVPVLVAGVDGVVRSTSVT